MKWLDFDPHTTFLKLKAVVYVIASIFALAAIVTLTIIYCTPGLNYNFSSEGWNNALDIFKVPLGLLAVAIPLIALLAANHRSVQSKAQMELTQSQIELTQNNNHLTNYYKHVDEFQKYVEGHVNNLKFIDGSVGRVAYPRKLHKMIFPAAKLGILKVDESFIKALCSDIEKVIDATAVFRAEKYENRGTQLHMLNARIDRLAKKYQVTNHRAKGIPEIFEMDGEFAETDISAFLYPFGLVSTVITESLLFDESFEAPPLIDQIARFNWYNVRPDKINNSMNYHFDHLLIDDTMVMVDDEEF
ncbi:hypothetical protein [Pseudomonas syringae]|uniref:hypothetical protein n=1 Tax=Pseudomonas syringae TaxID=317 RepID=UPI0018E63328|nr:hypothetical protein [Pseudomonas syringae]MBI6799335.1 hypothetical protein [Pseudomonas syringae]